MVWPASCIPFTDARVLTVEASIALRASDPMESVSGKNEEKASEFSALNGNVKGEEEAIVLANSTPFGLHSSVITQDAEKGKRIADQLEAGATCINDFGLCYLNQDLPFGGVKYSGYGRMNGREGLRSYTNHKAVMWDKTRFSIPPKLFPVGANDYEKAKASVGLMFGSGFKIKLFSLLKLIKFSLFK